MNRLLHREDQARIIERAFLRAVVVGFFAGAWAGVVGGGIVFMAVFAGVGAVIFLVSMSLGLIAQSRGR